MSSNQRLNYLLYLQNIYSSCEQMSKSELQEYAWSAFWYDTKDKLMKASKTSLCQAVQQYLRNQIEQIQQAVQRSAFLLASSPMSSATSSPVVVKRMKMTQDIVDLTSSPKLSSNKVYFSPVSMSYNSPLQLPVYTKSMSKSPASSEPSTRETTPVSSKPKSRSISPLRLSPAPQRYNDLYQSSLPVWASLEE